MAQLLGGARNSNTPEHFVALLIRPEDGGVHPPEEALHAPLARGAVVSVIVYTSFHAHAQARALVRALPRLCCAFAGAVALGRRCAAR